MRGYQTLFITALVFFTLSFSHTAHAVVEIVDSIFGTVSAHSTSKLRFTESTIVPGKQGTMFGWSLSVRVGGKRIVLREEFELPQAPPSWGAEEARGAFYVSPDRRTAVTERIIGLEEKSVYQVWNYAQGDPLGSHTIRIYFDGVLVRKFKFEIVEPEKESSTYTRKASFKNELATP
jgi:hypothetical protein